MGVGYTMMISYLLLLGKPHRSPPPPTPPTALDKYNALTGGNDMQLHDIYLLILVIVSRGDVFMRQQSCKFALKDFLLRHKKRIPYLTHRQGYQTGATSYQVEASRNLLFIQGSTKQY